MATTRAQRVIAEQPALLDMGPVTEVSAEDAADAPLAARMRPRNFAEFGGQGHLIGPGRLLRRAIEQDKLGSIILWGPPGSGKTTLAAVIARMTQAQFIRVQRRLRRRGRVAAGG